MGLCASCGRWLRASQAVSTFATACQGLKRSAYVLLAKVVGTVVATRKDPRLVSNKLMVVRPVDPRGKAEGNHLVAVDTVDAGVGETVLIVSGSSARMASGMKDCPVDAAVVGIIDTVDVTAGD